MIDYLITAMGTCLKSDHFMGRPRILAVGHKGPPNVASARQDLIQQLDAGGGEDSYAVPKLDWCNRADRDVDVNWGRASGRWRDISRLEGAVDAVHRPRSPRPSVSRPDQTLG